MSDDPHTPERSGVSPETTLTLAVAAVSFIALAALFAWTPLTPVNGGEDMYDGRYYAAMARTPWQATEMTRFAPFCWRVLTPWIVHALSMPAVEGFLMVSFLGQWATAILLWLLLRYLRVAPLLAAAGVAMHLTSLWGPRFAFWSPCHPETMTQLITLALLFAIVSGKPIVTAALFILGALQREQLMTLALFQALWLWRGGRSPLRAFALAALIALPGAAVILGLRLAIHPVNPRGMAETILYYLGMRWDHTVESHGLYVVRYLAGTLRSLGAVPWLILLGGPVLWRRLRGEWPWLVMALLTWVLVWAGGVDCERRVFHAFPLLLIPLLVHWRGTSLDHRTLPLLLWALLAHLAVNVFLVDFSTVEQMIRTCHTMFLPEPDLGGHLLRLSGVWAAFVAGGWAISRLGTGHPR
ncbi:hypothetical protein JXA47_04130 [Candidatus Sumerlaeota bacterium]|nr:hypothetical protein [Candidatus Sumerlaeota bacterium]